MKKLNKEKSKNKLYHNITLSLSFKSTLLRVNNKQPIRKRNLSSSFVNKSSNNPLNVGKMLLKNKILGRKGSVGSNTNVSKHNLSYQHLHWKSISGKAGVITNDSPYRSEEDNIKIEDRENRKKWICKNNFNLFVGKATTNRSFMIKNYVSKTPSNPPVLYNFRPIYKNKWIDEKGFLLC